MAQLTLEADQRADGHSGDKPEEDVLVGQDGRPMG
jgi:hypothetical protein